MQVYELSSNFLLLVYFFLAINFVYVIKVKNIKSILIIIFTIISIYMLGCFDVRAFFRYQGYKMNHDVDAESDKSCDTVKFYDGGNYILSFCDKVGSVVGNIPIDVIFDSSGEISIDSQLRSRSWKSAFEELSKISKRSELYQIVQLENIDAIKISTYKIWDSYYEVSYSIFGE